MCAILETPAETGTSRTPSAHFQRRASASGHRLFNAFSALENLPALAHSHTTLLRLLADGDDFLDDIVATIESDAALATAVLRAASRVADDARAATSVPTAVAALTRGELTAAVSQVPTYDFFDRSSLLVRQAGRLRTHALATQGAVQRIREELGLPGSGSLSVAALLHDIGKVVLVDAYEHYCDLLDVDDPPEERLRLERQALGIDHAMVGGVLLRRMRLPGELASTVEHHHADDARGDAAVIRLADMVAHYAAGQSLAPRELTRVAAAAGLDQDALRNVLTRPAGSAGRRSGAIEPCPLSQRQLEIIRMLRDGKVYKEIADALDVTDSTVRTHLHLAYSKLGVTDRAQAVLRATNRGWI